MIQIQKTSVPDTSKTTNQNKKPILIDTATNQKI